MSDQVILAGYVRISSEDQWKKFSPEAQSRLIQDLAKEKGWPLYNIYLDARTGTTKDRPELSALLNDSEAHLFNHLAIIETDRLSRDIEDWAHLIKELKGNGVTIIETSSRLTSKQKESGLVWGMKAVVGEYEGLQRKERIANGYKIAKELNAHLGKAPLGFEIVYQTIGHSSVPKLVPDSIGQAVIEILQAGPKISVRNLYYQLAEKGILIRPQVSRKEREGLVPIPAPQLITYDQTFKIYRAIREYCPVNGMPERLHEPSEFPRGSLKNKLKEDFKRAAEPSPRPI